MTVQHDRRPTSNLPLNGDAASTPALGGGQGHTHQPVVDGKPPTHSKVTAGLAALACAACCALPFLIAAGVLTGAGAAVAERGLLATSLVLVSAAGLMWYLKRRSNARKAAAGGGCASGNCGC